MISLNIVLLPATSDKREPDPLVYFAGGPGSAATEDAQGIAQRIPTDPRASRSAVCRPARYRHVQPAQLRTLQPGRSPELSRFLPPGRRSSQMPHATRDRTPISSSTRPTIAMADMDEIRAALGYEQSESVWRLLRNTRRFDLPEDVSAARAHRDAARRFADESLHAERFSGSEPSARCKASSRSASQTKSAIRPFQTCAMKPKQFWPNSSKARSKLSAKAGLERARESKTLARPRGGGDSLHALQPGRLPLTFRSLCTLPRKAILFPWPNQHCDIEETSSPPAEWNVSLGDLRRRFAVDQTRRR